MGRKILLNFSLVMLVACFSLYFVAGAQSLTAGQKADVKELLEVTGGLDLAKQISAVFVTQMMQVVKSARPDIPQEMLDIVTEETNKIIAEEVDKEGGFIDSLTEVYYKYYTQDDIKGLVKFYKSDLGEKVVRVTPALMQDSMMAGQRWSQSLEPILIEKITQRLEEEGIDLSQ